MNIPKSPVPCKTDNFLKTSQDSLVKSPWGAVARSAMLPGWGQHYNEKKLKAAIILGLEVGLITTTLLEDKWTWENYNKAYNPKNLDKKSFYLNRYEYHKDRKDLFIWWSAVVFLYNIADAYVDAHLFDFDEEKEGEPNFNIETKVYHQKPYICIRY